MAKLLDFGLVKTFDTEGDFVKLSRDGAFIGSPVFASPEQALGGKPLDARSDICNVGAVAYFLTTGQLSFGRLSTVQMLHAHGYEPFVSTQEFQEAVPADLQHVIQRCLETDPDRRYPDALTLEKALAACESAGQWTTERAEEWWWRHGAGTAVPSALEAR